MAHPGSGGPWEWQTLGVADPASIKSWEWRTLGVADPNLKNTLPRIVPLFFLMTTLLPVSCQLELLTGSTRMRGPVSLMTLYVYRWSNLNFCVVTSLYSSLCTHFKKRIQFKTQ